MCAAGAALVVGEGRCREWRGLDCSEKFRRPFSRKNQSAQPSTQRALPETCLSLSLPDRSACIANERRAASAWPSVNTLAFFGVFPTRRVTAEGPRVAFSLLARQPPLCSAQRFSRFPPRQLQRSGRGYRVYRALKRTRSKTPRGDLVERPTGSRSRRARSAGSGVTGAALFETWLKQN